MDSPTEPPSEGEVRPTVEADPRFGISAELRYVTAYFADGYRSGEDGLYIQPLLSASYEAVSRDGLSLTPYAYAWANVTDDHYEGGDYFDEVDLGLGVELALGRWTFAVEYVYYVSPADTFDDIHEIGGSIGFDDSGLTPLPFSINPFFTIYREVADTGGTEETRAVVGIEPTFEFDRLTLSVPIQLGLGGDGFYLDEEGDEDAVGYFSVGLAARHQLGDRWYVTAGVEYLSLLAEATKESNGGDGDAWVGGFAVGVEF